MEMQRDRPELPPLPTAQRKASASIVRHLGTIALPLQLVNLLGSSEFQILSFYRSMNSSPEQTQ
jgi:hypothetical protein